MSNSNKVTVDKLGSAIMKYLQEYKEDIEENVKELSDKNIKEARNELKSISPKTNRTVIIKGGTVVTPRKLFKILECKEW